MSLERADGALDLAACLRLHARERSESPVKAGEILAGRYRVERVLGMGAMGVVVAATHLGLGQLVALKFMLQTRAPQREQTERFLREAQVAVKLRSQHSARVIDVGVLENGAPYLVMELLEGRDLAAVLQSGATIAVAQAVDYLLQICEAIGEAHANGIVHRDLKPANLFLTTDAGGEPREGARLRRVEADGHAASAHGDGAGAGLAALHVTGADAGGARRRRAERHLVTRRRAVRAPGEEDAVPLREASPSSAPKCSTASRCRSRRCGPTSRRR